MLQNCEIIVTDDDADDRSFLAEALQRNDFKGKLLQAGNGLELLTILEKNSAMKKAWPDMIVLDLNMPILNGYQVLNKLKIDGTIAMAHVVILTSSSNREDEKFCIEAGCFKYYRKPFVTSGYDDIARDMLTLARGTNPCC